MHNAVGIAIIQTIIAIEYMSGQILWVEPLHHDDFGTGLWIGDARFKGAFVKVENPLADWFGILIARLQRIVDDLDITAAPRDTALEGCRDACTTSRCIELGLRLLIGAELYPMPPALLIPVGLNKAALNKR